MVSVMTMPSIAEPAAAGKKMLRIVVAGESMLPIYRPGMIVEFECLSTVCDLFDETFQVGRDYLVMLDGEAFFNRLEKIEDGTLCFRAINRRQFPWLTAVELSDIMAIAVARGEVIPLDRDAPDSAEKMRVPAPSTPKLCRSGVEGRHTA